METISNTYHFVLKILNIIIFFSVNEELKYTNFCNHYFPHAFNCP